MDAKRGKAKVKRGVAKVKVAKPTTTAKPYVRKSDLKRLAELPEELRPVKAGRGVYVMYKVVTKGRIGAFRFSIYPKITYPDGKTVTEAPRRRISRTPRDTCGAGLHVLTTPPDPRHIHFAEGSTVLEVRVREDDIACVPYDFHFMGSAKVRVRRLRVVGVTRKRAR